MALRTIVEDFVIAAMRSAAAESFEDGSVAATVPGCPGVITYGADQHECATELYARLETWVKLSLAASYTLPVIDGIDLNSQAGQVLATYHGGPGSPAEGTFYPDEDALEVAFRSHGEPE